MTTCLLKKGESGNIPGKACYNVKVCPTKCIYNFVQGLFVPISKYVLVSPVFINTYSV